MKPTAIALLLAGLFATAVVAQDPVIDPELPGRIDKFNDAIKNNDGSQDVTAIRLLDGFLAAYRSDEAARARKRGFLKQFGICKTCSFSNAENMGIRRDLKK